MAMVTLVRWDLQYVACGGGDVNGLIMDAFSNRGRLGGGAGPLLGHLEPPRHAAQCKLN